ncbi:MAG: T9SS type A sorting domain-containing protein [Ignavibacterium sp.]|uniref:alpha-amylase family glycosyl hydrolase n=1 Tax=Ignavibacterium album TaxID=591197 RepID=UPI0026EF66B7|nr:alpha-amylase family glycosyl hydrolase [Ignavibacterium album]MCA2004398.1 T9SS type A sorting domain-containing protein [Ignavibacterium sp.]MCX8105490.1 alpha-amylase family glycosyl hydrolase [Ignavibacterium album]
MKKLLIFSIIIFSTQIFSQIVVTQPQYPTQIDSIVIFFDATQPGAEELLNYTGTVYAHTGVNTNVGNWQHVIGNWGDNQTQPALTRLGPNLYKLTIGYPRIFYNVTNPSETIYSIALVFRSSDATKQTRPDIFVNLYQPGLTLIVQNPKVSVQFGDPQRSPGFVKEGETVPIDVQAVVIQTRVQSITLSVDGNQVAVSDSARLIYNFVYSDYSVGPHMVKVVGIDTAGTADSTTFMMFVNPPIVNAPLPNGIRPGINYTSPVTATLALFAPYKDFVYVIGDFNDWKVQTNYFMKRHYVNPDSVIWWIELTSLSPAAEYAFQYLVDGKIRTGDPYSQKVLDPWNDQSIPSTTYPNLKPYPFYKTEKIVSILQTAQSQFQWQVPNFQKPPKEKLVIYELLIRDFSTLRNYQFLIDTLSYLKSLGVNAIELMPVMEFSGNLSWGYNPIYHTALDKYYGTPTKLKQFIDLCHQNGIAVILDMVLNHADNLSPLAMMWWNDTLNRPAENNPYLNPVARHPFNVFNDFNHESNATKYFVDRVNEYWLKEFKFDGFRFDLSKGFTQNFTNDVGQWSQYDQSRINILKRMADKIWEVDSTAYVILEHFADNSEETVLANYGMMLWGNLNHDYSEAAMGYQSSLSWGSYKTRGWNYPHLITYMESHDEERLMYKNLVYGNSLGDYNIRNLSIALQRIKLAATFLFPIPGPKMFWQFGELGYDISIDYNGRTGEKPVRWDYLNDLRRKNLYKVFRELIKLKTNYEAFSTTNYTMDTGGYIKKINLYHPTMDVAIIGNFYVGALTPSANFSRTGWWYDFFSGDSINITNPTQPMTLQPGEFHIYTTEKLPTPEPGILLDVEDSEETIPKEFNLEQNYPNPFNPATKIGWQSPVDSHQTIKIYDVLGKEIVTLVDEYMPAGRYEIEFNVARQAGYELSSGVYFYRFTANGFDQTKKMMLLR